MSSVTVIGAGAVGLSTAHEIITKFPNCSVKVVADQFEHATTSYGAAGIFTPNYIPSYTKDPQRMAKWYNLSFRHFWNMIHSGEGHAAGIGFTPMYIFKELSPEDLEMMSNNVLNLRPLKPRDIAMMKLPKSITCGMACDSLLIEGRYLLQYLSEKIKEKGGSIEKRTIASPNELSKETDIIVNCTGLGARQLFNDDKMYPVRGQVVRVRAPWIKHVYMAADDTYIIPTRDSVVIGGCRQAGNWNRNVEEDDISSIFERTCKLVPSLKHASVLEHWVGLRPGRNGVRIELDTDSCDVPVVHNYGHDGKGLALSYGTAVEATELVTKLLRRSKL